MSVPQLATFIERKLSGFYFFINGALEASYDFFNSSAA
jgi:hypothetical protein